MPYSIGDTRSCPRCAAPVDAHETICPSCGYRPDAAAPAAPPKWTPSQAVPAAKPATPDYDMTRLGVALVAAAVLFYAGFQMTQLRSISGDSLAEAFYHTIGMATFGIAVLAIAVGLRKG